MKLKRLLAFYFKPRAVEYYQDATIYNLIGINYYKKYLPTTGDIARKKRKIIQINIGTAERINELYTYERQTRNLLMATFNRAADLYSFGSTY